jgi:Arc/MetJ-type ribon-helix-helix transcriptional regulator
MIRMPSEMIAAIDEYRRTQPDLPSRPEVIRRVVAAWLETLQEQAK